MKVGACPYPKAGHKLLLIVAVFLTYIPVYCKQYVRDIPTTTCTRVTAILNCILTYIVHVRISGFWLSPVINPRRACAERVTVVVSCVCVCMSVCLSVCLYVCLSEHAILAVRAARSITKDAIVLSDRFAAILKRCFS